MCLPAALTLALASGCAEPPPGIETEHLSLFVPQDERLCEGLIQDYDREVVRLSGLMGLPSSARIEVRYGEDAVMASCPLGVGCAGGWGDETWIAAADAATVGHELVHALRRQHALMGPASIEEGLAQVLRGRPGLRRGSAFVGDKFGGPLELWPLTPDELREVDEIYVSSGSVVDWMLGAFGTEAVLALVRGPAFDRDGDLDGVLAAVQTELGLSLEELDARWWDEAPLEYVAGTLCDVEGVLERGGSVVLEGRVDCEGDPDTLGAYRRDDGELGANSRLRCIAVASDGPASITYDATAGALEVVAGSDCPDPFQPTMSVSAGSTATFDLAACTWGFQVRAPALDPLDWSIEVQAG